MAAISTIIAGVGIAASVAGTAVSYMGQRSAVKASERAEAIRKRQMDLEAQRERRSAVRQSILARAQTLTAGTQMGAGAGSGVAGGLGSLSSQLAGNIRNINQGQQLGTQMFGANADMARGQGMASMGAGISSLGGTLVNNAGTFGRVGTYMTQRT